MHTFSFQNKFYIGYVSFFVFDSVVLFCFSRYYQDFSACGR